MAKKERRVLTKEERSMFINAVQMRMPQDRIALLLSTSVATLRRILKRDAELRDAVARAEPLSSLKIRNTLFDAATGRRPVIERTLDPDTGKYTEKTVIKGRDPDARLLEFWCKTQEGFTYVEKHEHSGPDGRPIEQKVTAEVREPSKEELYAELGAIANRISKAVGEVGP